MLQDNNAITQEIVQGIRRLVRAVYQDAAHTSKQHGITPTQSGVLRILLEQGPLSSAGLSRRLFVTPANITGVVDRLEKKKLVTRTRQQEDRRVVLISLTDPGRDLAGQLPDPIERRFIESLADLPEERARELADSLCYLLTLVGEREIGELTPDLDQGC